MKVVTFDPKRATAAAIEEIIWEETGHRVKLNQANITVSRLESLDDMWTRLAEVSPSESHVRLALNTK